jgi:hypothetical protein
VCDYSPYLARSRAIVDSFDGRECHRRKHMAGPARIRFISLCCSRDSADRVGDGFCLSRDHSLMGVD